MSAEQLAGGKLVLDHPAEAVARLTITRPDARNALDDETLSALTAALPSLDDGIEVRCLILTGAGTTFSAGYDIRGIAAGSFDSEHEEPAAHPFEEALAALAAHPWPVVAAINGSAIGGGLELALCCDLRVCAAGAKLGMPPAKLGIVYSHTGLRRFIEAIGVPRTKQLFLTGRNVSAERAAQIGLVHELSPDDQLADEALALATEIAANAPLSIKGGKRAIDTLAAFPRLSPKQEQELVDLRAACFESEDLREGISAFNEKRKPEWRGR